MRIDADTGAVAGVAQGLRALAVAVRGVALPHAPPCEDVRAADAVRALLDVSAQRLAEAARELTAVAVLAETAAADYARAEARAAKP